MAAPIGPKKVHRYTVEFKIQAVRLSLHPENQTQDVANALDHAHAFRLARLRVGRVGVAGAEQLSGRDDMRANLAVVRMGERRRAAFSCRAAHRTLLRYTLPCSSFAGVLT